MGQPIRAEPGSDGWTGLLGSCNDCEPAGRAFSRLRAQEAESGFVEKSPAAPTFFRAGIAGSWRTVLAPVQVRAVVDAYGEVVERFGDPKEARAFLRGYRAPKPR